jgi:enamine deaminase RidA (YjgF/YER057c/UK114 family)
MAGGANGKRLNRAAIGAWAKGRSDMAKAPRRKKAPAKKAKKAARPAPRRTTVVRASAPPAPPRRVRQIMSDRVPEPNPPGYSNCLVFGDTVYLAGMTAGDGKGGIEGNGTPFGQARQCFLKIRRMLKAAGCKMSDVVKMTVYVTDMGMRPDLWRARAEFFQPPMPCSTLVQVSALAQPSLLIEVDATAVKQTGR